MSTSEPQRQVPLFLRLLSAASLASVLGYLALAATGHWTILGELACQFRFAFSLVVAVAVLPFLLARQWRRGVFAGLIAAWCVVPEGALPFLAGPSDTARGPTLSIVCANVLRPNERHQEVFDALLAKDADVIGLLEFSPAWRDAALVHLGTEYPFHVAGQNTAGWNEHTWGLMLFSKTPITDFGTIALEGDNGALRPVVQASVDAPFPVTFQLTHPERPGRAHRFRARRATLQAISASDVTGHRVVMGDLNSTSTSPFFRDLIDATELRDSRDGFGRQPTWFFGTQVPGPWPLPLPKWARLGVAIDHALVSAGLNVLERETLDVPGSDHRAVYVVLEERATQSP